MAGYTRQSESLIQDGETIDAADFNQEFDQLELAFDATGGHTHSGTVGDSPQIPLTTGVTGILPVANGGLGIGAFGAGSIPFSNGTTFAQDGANLFWDDTNNRLGVGTNSPAYRVHIHSTTATAVGMLVTNSATGATGGDGLLVQVDDTGNGFLWNYENKKIYIGNNNAVSAIFNASGNLSLGNANDTYKLDVTGTIHASNTIIDGSMTVGVDAIVSGNFGTAGLATVGSLSVLSTANITGALSAGAISSPSAAISNLSVAGTVSASAVTASSAITSASLTTTTANVATLQLSGVNILTRNGVHTAIANPTGSVSLFLGGSDPTNYYDNTSHVFRSSGGGSNLAIITSSGISTISGAFSGNINVSSNGNFGGSLSVSGTATANTSQAVSAFYVNGLGGIYGTAGLYKSGNTIVMAAHTPHNAYFTYDGGSGNWYLGNTNSSSGIQWTVSDGWWRDTEGPCAGNGAYQNLSDRRLKTDIVPTEKGLSEILALNPVSFKRVNTFREMPTELGFIAQEILESGLTEAVAESPNHIDENDTPILSLSFDTITTCLVNAVKTMHETIESLQATITTLQDRIHTLEQGS